jgi:hypothetical protein
VIGTIDGLVDGAVAALIFAAIYNGIAAHQPQAAGHNESHA